MLNFFIDKNIIIVFCVLSFCGCSTVKWTKANYTESQFNLDDSSCSMLALTALPPVYSETTTDTVLRRGSTSCSAPISKYDSVRCTTTPDYTVPITTSHDVNESNRKEFHKLCLINKGYNQVYEKPKFTIWE